VHPKLTGRPVEGFGENAGVSIARIWWLVATLAALLTGILLFVSGYNGYGALSLAVAASAAINLT
jgi:hypothetical protein